MSSFPLMTLDSAIDTMLSRIEPIATEQVSLHACGGRVLAEALTADRDSPACDVSAMDGFAVRTAEIVAGPLPIDGECSIGKEPKPLPPGVARRIFTGSPIPSGADTVVKIEETIVENETVALREGAKVGADEHLRHRGENGLVGRQVLARGVSLSPVAVTAAASVVPDLVSLFCKVRVSVITTGNELVQAGDTNSRSPEPWRLRDSNGPSLLAMLSPLPWIEAWPLQHAIDTPEGIEEAIRAALAESDIVILTGGVSKGDHDYVPEVVQAVGGEILFHGLKIRPGKPVLGAIAEGKPIFGLPGNPLSVLVTARQILGPVLRCVGGHAVPRPQPATVTLKDSGEKTLPLLWHRPVRIDSPGMAQVVRLQGSGDVIGAAESDGFVAIPPHTSGPGPYPFYPWTL